MAFTKQADFFLNGLCLLLKNPEGIRSTLEVFVFFFFPLQINLHGS